MATDKTNQTIKLKDGRSLGYAEYGNPEGKPVFYFHGFPGSRLDWPFSDADDSAAQLNTRIVAVDRPGMGLSDFKRGREILDWPDDVIELADALQVDHFAVQGISGGGPYACACAFKISERLTTTAVSLWNGSLRSTSYQGGDVLDHSREALGDTEAVVNVVRYGPAEESGPVRIAVEGEVPRTGQAAAGPT